MPAVERRLGAYWLSSWIAFAAASPRSSAATRTPRSQVLLRDVARVREGVRPGEHDRGRYISLTANIEGSDLGRVAT